MASGSTRLSPTPPRPAGRIRRPPTSVSRTRCTPSRIPARRAASRRGRTVPCRIGGPALGLLLGPLPILRLPRPDLGDPVGDLNLEPLRRLARVVEVLHHDAW